jgi:hypothetical protein
LYVGLAGHCRRRWGIGLRAGWILLFAFTAGNEVAEARRLLVRGRLGPVVAGTFSGFPFLGFARFVPQGGLRSGARPGIVGRRRGALPIAMVTGPVVPIGAAASSPLRFDDSGAFGPVIAGSGGAFDPRALASDASFRSPFPLAWPPSAAFQRRDVGNPPLASPVASGCGVVVDGRDGHGGGALCRDPRPGAATGARALAPQAAALGDDGRLKPTACRNLNAALCGGRNPVDEERRVFAEGRSIVNAVEGYLARDSRNRPLAVVFANVLRNPTQFFDQYAAYLGLVARQTGAFDAVAARTLDRVREGIDGTAFSQGTKDAMKSKLADVSLRLVPRADLESLRTFVAQCGADGMAPSAFTVPERKEIVVCPGMALRARALGGDLTSHLMHVIAHEAGHNCGADKFPSGEQSEFRGQFAAFGACLRRRHPSFDPNGMLGEAVADAIGFRAVAKEMASRDPADAFAFLRRTVSPLCGTQGDGVHPSGAFRINVLLGEDPAVLEALGCPVTGGGCPLEGGTP